MRKHLQQQRMHSLQYQYCPFLIPTDLLACVLMQADKGLVLFYSSNDITWNLIQAGSHFLTEAESRYAVIELEMLAVCWAIQKYKLFLTGLQHFSVITDHNPLVSIINNYRLDEIEKPRLQRLKTRLISYNFTTKWLKGSKNEAPDALSCNPVSDPEPTDTLAELDVNDRAEMSIVEIRALHGETHENRHLQDLQQQAEQDEEYIPTATYRHSTGIPCPPQSMITQKTWVKH